ncbi:hypothetical protein FB451DRAFT_1561723 [Mycena latifolia]|nr:hypothetical protein FB451DRAFT_1561723 [Mycena latifolia]
MPTTRSAPTPSPDDICAVPGESLPFSFSFPSPWLIFFLQRQDLRPYTLVIVLMDGAVLLAALILNPRAAKRRRAENTRAMAESDTTGSGLSSRAITRVATPSSSDSIKT